MSTPALSQAIGILGCRKGPSTCVTVRCNSGPTLGTQRERRCVRSHTRRRERHTREPRLDRINPPVLGVPRWPVWGVR